MSTIDTLRERYIAEYGREACEANTISKIESVLEVELPEDFKKICEFYSGGLLGGISHHEISNTGDATNLCDETLRLRKAISLDKEFVVIAEPPESLIVMKTTGDLTVIWCDALDARNISSQEFTGSPQLWETYADFFEYLLNEDDE